MGTKYDTIGIDYAALRQPDPRIASLIDTALGSAETVLNIGAGTGSYEPTDRAVTALDPSATMIAQRPPGAAPALQGRAEALPFADQSFDATMAILTVHHWQDQAKGLSEMRRVSRGPLVILTYDPEFRGFWLADNYLPALTRLDDETMPPLALFGTALGPHERQLVPIPHDCCDGFLCAYWRRPEAYLDPRVRAAISPFWAIGDTQEALSRLAADLEDGTWASRHSALLEKETLDLGYRLLIWPAQAADLR